MNLIHLCQVMKVRSLNIKGSRFYKTSIPIRIEVDRAWYNATLQKWEYEWEVDFKQYDYWNCYDSYNKQFYSLKAVKRYVRNCSSICIGDTVRVELLKPIGGWVCDEGNAITLYSTSTFLIRK